MKLTDDQQRVVRANQGCVQAEGTGDRYVVMSMNVYREMMGVGTNEDLAASLEAIDQGLADVDADRTRPYRELLAELDTL